MFSIAPDLKMQLMSNRIKTFPVIFIQKQEIWVVLPIVIRPSKGE